MQLEIGSVCEGKVNSIMNFGAFVTLPDGSSGLVHISEIASTYVRDIHDYLTEGQTVKVKIVGRTPDGKINLSIKKAEPAAQASPRPAPAAYQSASVRPAQSGESAPSSDAGFEQRLKQFMQESDSRIAGSKLYANHKISSRRRNGNN